MTQISFIITTYNIESYIGQCLKSLAACLMPGDQVVLVDDGSTDGTAKRVEQFVSDGGFPEGILWTPVWFGTNTMGGVGIAANVGMDYAERDTIFFVDGDDYLVPDAFLRARRAFSNNSTDIFLVNYDEFDDQKKVLKKPADSHRWPTLERSLPGEQRRIAALAMIAVPWRKFYRRSFLAENKIRFPEGDFFFEDNPFHWRVCRHATSIGFSNQLVCHHRINRPGQTMASTGIEFVATFTHFSTIWNEIPAPEAACKLQAVRWLIGNISWQIPRLNPQAWPVYFAAASSAFSGIPNEIWGHPELADQHASLSWYYATEMRSGNTWRVVQSLQNDRIMSKLAAMGNRISAVETKLKQLTAESDKIKQTVQARRDIDIFQSILHMRG